MKNTNSPITFGQALIKNSDAMDKYLHLPKSVQEEILYNAMQISSNDEMQSFINSIKDL